MIHILTTLLALTFTHAAFAQTSPTLPEATPTYTQAQFVYHPATGTVLSSLNADTPAGPASLTKLMTLYLTFEALQEGRLQLTTPVTVSEKAWRTGGSKMFIEVGKQVPVEMLIKGISIVSGNDACVAMAEQLGGTEDGFASMMNAKAKDLGMTNTTFRNASGMPHPEQRTTAHDIAQLLTAIFRDFPQYKHFLAEEEFTWNNIKQQNRNGLLHAGIGIDAGKTGHTEESGYHLASTAEQNGERLVVVVMGTDGFNAREGQSLQAYRTFYATHATRTLFQPGDILAENIPVWHGSAGTTNLTVAKPLNIFLSRTTPGAIKASITYNQPLVAPLPADKPVGKLTVTLPSGQTFTEALVVQHPIARAGFVGRFTQTLTTNLGF